MARKLYSYSELEIRGTVHFLWVCLNCTEIHLEIVRVYVKHAISRIAVMQWCEQFEMTDPTSLANTVQGDLQHPFSAETVVVEQVLRDS